MNKKQIIGIVIFVVLIGIVIGIKALSNIGIGFNSNLTTVYVATGGGKEDFIADEEVNEINDVFKKFLNNLYQSDMIDTNVEIKVLNSMLKSDGLDKNELNVKEGKHE